MRLYPGELRHTAPDGSIWIEMPIILRQLEQSILDQAQNLLGHILPWLAWFMTFAELRSKGLRAGATGEWVHVAWVCCNCLGCAGITSCTNAPARKFGSDAFRVSFFAMWGVW